MDINLTDDPKISVAAKIPMSWCQEIDAICELTQVTKSQWVGNLIGDALGKTDGEAKRKAIQKLSNLIAQSV
ncbi:hypothetical protein Syn7502_03669 (plasmid) [Synechococcus sp. PCC 7502]|uniref:hypothetical protein n=1 Tax=Synechococcus sp. PCC 7502 TaxID=1173263 RepID=UPI00029FF59E|nr:hypothetical protein [Synechococcus sp. PCC 7502]AFY75491.1 hypothetical protein Syn7502_03669 [Synechococcus sp. PCC 7502]